MRPLVLRGGTQPHPFEDGWAFSLVLIVVSTILTGCTTVSIHSDGWIETKKYLGMTVINVNPEGQSVTTKVRSFGIVKSPSAFNLGYLKETQHISEKDCELILFEPDVQDIKTLSSLLRIKDETLCTTTQEVTHDEK